jgi:menaquinone-dependent protoporphyrinogen IX oxidase
MMMMMIIIIIINIIRIAISRSIGCTGHVANIKLKNSAYKVLVGSLQERDYQEDLDFYDRIILKLCLKMDGCRLDSSGLG